MKRSAKSPATPLHPHLKGLAPYPPGKPIEEVQREFGLKEVVKLASNENPLGPSPRAMKAMSRVADEMNLYPDGAGYYLKQGIAKKLSVTPEEIVLGNGSDEITLFLALCYLGKDRSIVTSNYAFIRYTMAATLMNARTKIVPMRDFRHDVAGIIKAVDKTTAIVFVDSPCNPTGAILTQSELETLLKKIPSHVLVVLDEAYYEFARADKSYPDSLALRKRYPNLIVTRTFSKAYGLAGLRIGYGIAPAAVTHDLDRVRPPFNTSRMAQAATLAALDDAAHLRRVIANNEKGKAQLNVALTRLGFRCLPSWGNFILAEVPKDCPPGAELYASLLRKGVIVRPMDGYGLKRHVRVSIGLPRENKSLIRALNA